MYSESELAQAVEAGILAPAQLDALRAHIAAQRDEASTADDEQIRLVTGFNDIFVTIAVTLVLIAAWAIGFIPDGDGKTLWLSGLLVATSSWLMAEVFTRKKRMALPSIVLLLSFVLGIGFFGGALTESMMSYHEVTHSLGVQGWQNGVADTPSQHSYTTQELYPWQTALIAAIAAITGGMGAALHWLRFRVAITVAAAVGAVVLLLLSGVAAATDSELGSQGFIAPAAIACGLAVFALAMRFDLADPARTSIRADIAFWLHLLAAPLIAHPLFHWIGVTQGDAISAGAALGVFALYLLFGVVALAVDRRALLVSALAYVLIALGRLLNDHGNVTQSVALTALIIGSALLTLSAYWGAIRTRLLSHLPAKLAMHLPTGSRP